MQNYVKWKNIIMQHKNVKLCQMKAYNNIKWKRRAVSNKSENDWNLRIRGSVKSEQVASFGADLMGTNFFLRYSVKKTHKNLHLRRHAYFLFLLIWKITSEHNKSHQNNISFQFFQISSLLGKISYHVFFSLLFKF